MVVSIWWLLAAGVGGLIIGLLFRFDAICAGFEGVEPIEGQEMFSEESRLIAFDSGFTGLARHDDDPLLMYYDKGAEARGLIESQLKAVWIRGTFIQESKEILRVCDGDAPMYKDGYMVLFDIDGGGVVSLSGGGVWHKSAVDALRAAHKSYMNAQADRWAKS